MDDQSLQMFTRQKQYIMMLLLVCATTLGMFGLMGLLAFVDIPKDNKDVFSNALMMIATAWVGITAYFFSTSASSANKDDKPVKPIL
jgi:hypothetical protein